MTGASGFVGRRLLARLLADGQPAVALSRCGTGLVGVREVVVADYADTARLASSLEGVELLVHLAARAHLESAGEDDEALFHAANVDVTLAVARACIVAGVKRFVLVSSIGVNGHRTTGRPFTADDVPCPAEPYATSKWEAERALASLLRGTALEYVILRPPLVYGPGCPGNFGRLVRLVARAPVIPLGALSALRSFIYVDNLVDALLVAGRHPGIQPGPFLLADGRDISVGEVVRQLAAELRPGSSAVRNVPPWLLAGLARCAGRAQAYAKLASPLQVDASAFSRATGWRAPFDPGDGLRETARHYAAPGPASGRTRDSRES